MAQRCAGGDAQACLAAGEDLMQAAGGTPEPARPLEQFRTGCRLRNARACVMAAVIEYVQEHGPPEDLNDALMADIMRASCMQGAAESCAVLGGLYNQGEVAEQDYVLARKFLERACSLDDGFGCTLLGALYHDGSGVRADFARAREYCARACGLQDAPCCMLLGELHYLGLGGTRDAKQAREYYGKACDAGHQPGCDACRRLLIMARRP